MPARFQRLLDGKGRSVSMMVGSEPTEAKPLMARARPAVEHPPGLGAADQDGGGAVHDPDELPGVMNMVERSTCA